MSNGCSHIVCEVEPRDEVVARTEKKLRGSACYGLKCIPVDPCVEVLTSPRLQNMTLFGNIVSTEVVELK